MILEKLSNKVNPKKKNTAGRWWRTPLIPTLGRQKQADLCEFEASLGYRKKQKQNQTQSKQTNKKPPSPYVG